MPLRPTKRATPRLPAALPHAPGDTPPNGSFVASDTSAIERLPGVGPTPIERLQHYRLLELIGRGGMGDVYRAHDEMFDRVVAVKVLPADLAQDETFVHRFQREAKAIAGLSHPNIVPIYTIDQAQGYSFFAMQFVAGESLEHRLRRAKSLPLQASLRIVADCLSALEAAHAKGLVHRDVKPGNVLLQEGADHVFLVDFGLVRRIDDQSLLTVTGMVMGTVDYIAPEQARGEKQIDHRADLYSVGAMLYHLLAGRLPFDSTSFSDMLYSHAYESPFPLDKAAPEVPTGLVELVQRLMAKQPQDRPANCRDVLRALEPFRTREFRSRYVADQAQLASGDRAVESECLAWNHLAPAYTAWQSWQDFAATAMSQRRPAWLADLQPIEQQVAQALAASERRKQRLLALRLEGHHLLSELQTENDRSQIAELTEQLAQLDLEIAKTSAQQGALSRRRDALAARLMTFNSKARLRQTRALLWMVGLASAVLMLAGLSHALWPERSTTVPLPVNESNASLPLAIAPFDSAGAKQHQQAWASHLKLPVERDIELPGGVKLPLMLIPPGEFWMGSTAEEQVYFLAAAKRASDQRAMDEITRGSPQHWVRITRPFYLGKCEFTQAQWQALMGSNPAKFQLDPTHPVEQVSWNDAQRLVAKLNSEHAVTGMQYVLPTEAQWEFACRAGTTTPWYSGHREAGIESYAWCNGTKNESTQPVGGLRPNAWGLFDMHGNVWELCADYISDDYSRLQSDDPRGSPFGSDRVNRGGSAIRASYRCRSSHRGFWPQGRSHAHLGFRVALVFDSAAPSESIADPLQRGLVAHYKFDEGQGSLVRDVVNGLDGRIEGATWTQDTGDGATATKK